ncbi:MAG: ATP-binding cassette domain-containing protein [Oscillospiraceae bacterium]|nr:ATP-binding cassette domain-containing protein [Oscillospiraceae bacterium]
MIRIEHLSKIYQTKTQVDALKDISLHVQPGDIYGIIGMSGAGKSTLLRCISFLEQPTSGSIFLDGTDMSSVSPRQLQEIRKEMGVIFQGYNLLMQKTIRKNIAFPLELNKTPKADIDKRVDELLRIVGLSDKADFYPAQLSGGQRQRVAIARALATNPKVLLCDEPTSALDPLTTRSILELLRDINRNLGVTIIVITHELGVVRSLCQKVAVIDQGSIVEQGLTAQVMDAPQNDITKLLISTAGGR